MATLLEKIENEPRTHVRLSDFIKIKHGFAFKGEYFSARPTKDVLVTPGNFAIGGGFKADKFKYYAGAVPEDYILKAGDLVVTMTDLSVDADTLGYSALIPNDSSVQFLHNQRVGLVQQIKEGIDLGFLYYLMRTREYQSYVVGGASGSTVKHTSPDRIASFEYDFPSLPTQRKIAEILYAYEEKIENNNSNIKKLETLAKEFFEEWFVKFRFPGYEQSEWVENETEKVPKGWKIGTISKIADINPRTEVETSVTPFVEMRDLPENGMSFVFEQKREVANGSRFKNHDTLLARITPCLENGKTGYVNCLDEEEVGCGSTEFIVLRPKATYFREYIYLLARNDKFRRFAIGRMVGSSGRQRVSGADIDRFQIIEPEADIIQKFHNITSRLFKKIREASSENQILEQSRNILLSKLIN